MINIMSQILSVIFQSNKAVALKKPWIGQSYMWTLDRVLRQR